MSGQHPYETGEEPEGVDPYAGDEMDDGAEGDGGELLPLPVRLHESAWSRMGDAHSATVAQWVPAPPGFDYEDVTPAWRRWLGSRLAAVALAAVLGGVVGGLAVSRLGGGAAESDIAVEALRNSIGQLASEVRSLRDGFGEGSEVTAQGLAKIEERIAGAEEAQQGLTARIADLSSRAAAATLPAQAVSREITGSVKRAPLPVAHDWTLWRVRNGRALVQGGAGYFEVVQGSALPGLGIVQRIVKEDGDWKVYTPGAVIVARG